MEIGAYARIYGTEMSERIADETEASLNCARSKWSSRLDESASAFDRKRNVTKIIAKILEYHKSRYVLLCACLRLSCVIA